MRAVFVHDHKFRRINGEIYSPGGLPNDVLSRYVGWFGSVIVVGRIIDEDQTKANYSKITNSNVMIVTGENLKRLIKEGDCVIARVPSINGYKAISFAKKYKKPYLVEVVGCTFDAYWNYGLKGKILAIPAYLVMRHYVKDAPFTLYVTSEFLQKRYPCKGKTIGISDVAIESTNETTIENRITRIKKNNNSLVLGTAGAIDVEYKGQEYVIKAIPELMKTIRKDIRYELVGDGDTQKLRKIAEECGVEDRVVFKGSIKHDEIFGWFDTIDIYIQSSLLEGLSRAVVEAMSRGLPCVAANKGGNPELVEKEYLFSTDRKEYISKEISRCVQTLIPMETRLEAANRNYFISNHDYDNDLLNTKRMRFYSSFKEFCSVCEYCE